MESHISAPRAWDTGAGGQEEWCDFETIVCYRVKPISKDNKYGLMDRS